MFFLAFGYVMLHNLCTIMCVSLVAETIFFCYVMLHNQKLLAHVCAGLVVKTTQHYILVQFLGGLQHFCW